MISDSYMLVSTAVNANYMFTSTAVILLFQSSLVIHSNKREETSERA